MTEVEQQLREWIATSIPPRRQGECQLTALTREQVIELLDDIERLRDQAMAALDEQVAK